MAEITTGDLLKKIDAQSVAIGRLELQREALARENEVLKKAIPTPPPQNRADRRRKGKEKK